VIQNEINGKLSHLPLGGLIGSLIGMLSVLIVFMLTNFFCRLI
jgi:hypothetical protein